jgi:hypothetical protein
VDYIGHFKKIELALHGSDIVYESFIIDEFCSLMFCQQFLHLYEDLFCLFFFLVLVLGNYWLHRMKQKCFFLFHFPENTVQNW